MKIDIPALKIARANHRRPMKFGDWLQEKTNDFKSD